MGNAKCIVIDNAQDIINNILLTGDSTAKISLLKHCDGNTDILKVLSEDSNPTVRSRVAQYCNGNADVLMQLAGDANKDVRTSVAIYSEGNADISRRFLSDLDWEVRSYAAQYCTDPSVLDEFANDSSEGVRKIVAENKNSNSNTLEKLSCSGGRSCIINDRIARNPNCSVETLIKLSELDDPPVYAIAENHNTPVEILAKLAEDEDQSVRLRVAINPNSSDDILADLAYDEDECVCEKARENLNIRTLTIKTAIGERYNERLKK